MPSADLLNLPLEIQTALGGGFLAYALAYAGLNDRLTATDVVFRTLAFGLVALLTFRMLLVQGPVTASLVAIGMALLAGMLWRMIGMRAVSWILRTLGVHGEDGIYSAWTALIQRPNLSVAQLSVHTKDGRILYQNQHQYPEAPFGGIYFGRDGSILMVVEEEELADGTEEVRTGIQDAATGTRMTYIPADQITRVNIR